MLTALLCLLALPYAILLAIALHGMRRQPETGPNIEFIGALEDEARANHNRALREFGNECEAMSREYREELAEAESAGSKRLRRAIVAANRQMLRVVR